MAYSLDAINYQCGENSEIRKQIQALVGPEFTIKIEPAYSNWGFTLILLTKYTSPGGMVYPEYRAASFAITDVPTCCGVCLSSGTSINPPWQKKGLGVKFMQIKMMIAAAAGFGQVQCNIQHTPTHEGWKRQINLLEGTGWTKVSEFNNPRSHHVVSTWVRDPRVPVVVKVKENAPLPEKAVQAPKPQENPPVQPQVLAFGEAPIGYVAPPVRTLFDEASTDRSRQITDWLEGPSVRRASERFRPRSTERPVRRSRAGFSDLDDGY